MCVRWLISGVTLQLDWCNNKRSWTSHLVMVCAFAIHPESFPYDSQLKRPMFRAVSTYPETLNSKKQGGLFKVRAKKAACLELGLTLTLTLNPCNQMRP
jgi:hypothetical protein